MKDFQIWLILLILILIGVVVVYVYFKLKQLRLNSINMVCGGVGAGKSITSLYLAIKQNKKEIRLWYIKNAIRKVFKKEHLEKPLLYSNIPIFNYPYVEITNDLLMRDNVRFNYRSTILLDEASLIACSLDYKAEWSNNLHEFIKLVRQSTKGGMVFINTQSKNDMHYSFDRSIDSVLYITKAFNVPFVRLCWVRDVTIMDNMQNVFYDDIQEDNTSRLLIIPKSYYNKYDSYALSKLTDDFKPKNDIINRGKKKPYKRFYIPAFHKWDDIEKNNEIVLNEKEENNK